MSIFDLRSLALTGLLLVVAIGGAAGQDRRLPNKTTKLWGPHAEWSLDYPAASGNEYDVLASATFVHEETEVTRRSLMFYSGRYDTWKFRFTGIRPGDWQITTRGPGNLGGWTGRVTVTTDDREPPR